MAASRLGIYEAQYDGGYFNDASIREYIFRNLDLNLRRNNWGETRLMTTSVRNLRRCVKPSRLGALVKEILQGLDLGAKYFQKSPDRMRP